MWWKIGPLLAFCWLTVLTVSRSHWEKSTSVFLGTHHRTSCSFRVPARTSKQGAERDERPLRWQCPCAHWQSDLFIASQCRSPNLWGFWKAWPGEFLPFHTMCCQIFDVKLEQHCHFPPMTDSLNCKAEMMSKWYQDWSQAVTAAEWDNYRELMNSKHKRVFEDF